MTHSIVDDGFNLIGLIAQGAKCFGHGLVDDLEITTACQLLELHQSKVWLNSRGVAIHHQTNGAGWGNHSGLGVAVAWASPSSTALSQALRAARARSLSE